MNANTPDTLRKRLDELELRVDAKKREFEDHGEFSDVHKAFMAEIQKRQTAIKNKINEALGKGISWNLIEAEYELDLNGLSDELLRWEERLDAETTKKNMNVAGVLKASNE